ncbi:hypothetical protein Xbed_01851 [Xenorhabdus beddingii]|uniref:Uncharacterized protein n=1 Tax=Xenorhabdus beddingii TaxID=40578 RepID=A0A1Y2SQF3_9GAMM|nr:hypothetical protein [Xenorhabdus beddingii]OTA19921.1 hypothetical protein Xbed_01851 [Xenorhabdus beddingii]
MRKILQKITVVSLISSLSLFMTPIVHAWTMTDLQCKNQRAYVGYITAISIGYYHSNSKDDHIALVFRDEGKQDQPGKIILTDVNYSDPAGPAFFSIAQAALLTGQKIEMWCNGTWINGIWLGEGAGVPLGYGLP